MANLYALPVLQDTIKMRPVRHPVYYALLVAIVAQARRNASCVHPDPIAVQAQANVLCALPELLMMHQARLNVLNAPMANIAAWELLSALLAR